MEYDENKAIDFIKSRLDEEARARIDGDEILNVIDMIFDYYDENGLLEIDMDDDDDDEVDLAQLTAYVAKMVAKDKKSPLNKNDIETIVKAELDYEASLE